MRRADVGIGPYKMKSALSVRESMNNALVREHPEAPLCKGSCQRS